MECALEKPREPRAEAPEDVMHVQNIFDRDPGIRLVEQSEVSVQVEQEVKEYVYKASQTQKEEGIAA